jgi:hypothetical protein
MSSEEIVPLQDPGFCLRHPEDSRTLAKGSPLLFYPLSNLPMKTRLEAMRTAIAEGADPNQLDKRNHTRIGRPLNYAINESWPEHDGYYVQLKQNLPIIELLLDAGADPRIASWRLYSSSPIEELEWYFKNYNDTWSEELKGLYEFYEKALSAMKKLLRSLTVSILHV